ncbi:MAG: hypothetical protein FWD73_06940 [Polyangiaceae bacterium]|nr:hypothetical protein [Polyangiaceae bacterium]
MAPSDNPYCSRSDVTRRLPPGSLGSATGIAACSAANTDEITYDGHGFESGDPVRVRALEGSHLSSPLEEGTTYYAIRTSNSAFKLAATEGGAPIDLTSDAFDVFVYRDPDFDGFIEFYSRWADTFLPAHVVPLEPPVHPLVRGIVADLVAARLLNIGGQDSALMTAVRTEAMLQLKDFARGYPLRGAPTTASANLSVVARRRQNEESRVLP